MALLSILRAVLYQDGGGMDGLRGVEVVIIVVVLSEVLAPETHRLVLFITTAVSLTVVCLGSRLLVRTSLPKTCAVIAVESLAVYDIDFCV